MRFDPGFDISLTAPELGFSYGAQIFGPPVERRRLDDIRKSLLDPRCAGPEHVYAIAMDVGRGADHTAIRERNLLYGAVVYEKGMLGQEPVRSQGHVHAVSPSCGSSTCELYEIWEGEACIYMQQRAADDPGRCYGVLAGPGQVVLVPPGWAHCTIVADVSGRMAFGAWCVRDYGFEYDGVRAHRGLAWYPVVRDGQLRFLKNECYQTERCVIKRPRHYAEFGLEPGVPIYRQFIDDPDCFAFVARPQSAVDGDGASKWDGFIP